MIKLDEANEINGQDDNGLYKGLNILVGEEPSEGEHLKILTGSWDGSDLNLKPVSSNQGFRDLFGGIDGKYK